MIIDIHTHAFPDAVAVRAMPDMAARSGLTPYTNGTINGLVKLLSEHKIDIAFLQPVATKPSQTESINRWSAEACERHTCLRRFGAIHPANEHPEDILSALKTNGVRGIKLHPDYQDFFADDQEVYPLYEAAAALDMAILFHAGVDIGLPPPVHCTPERLIKVRKDFPSLTIIAAHMGGFRLWKEAADTFVGQNILIDTSMAFEMGKEQFKNIIHRYGSEHVLFGSDCPWGGPAQTVELLRECGLSDRALEEIFKGNARRILGEI